MNWLLVAITLAFTGCTALPIAGLATSAAGFFGDKAGGGINITIKGVDNSVNCNCKTPCGK